MTSNIGVDYLSIKDFSAFTGVKQSTLRYYDDIGLFSPVHRAENGYRYYSPQQIITINMIKVLNDLDVPIRQINELERERSPEKVLSLLMDREGMLEAELRKLSRSYDVIRTFRRIIHSGLSADENEISIQYMDEHPLILGGVNNFEGSRYFYDTFLTFCSNANSMRIDLDYPVGGIFDDIDAYLAKPGEPTRFFSVDPNGQDMKPAGKYLVGYNRGYYGETGDIPQKLKQFADDHDLIFSGPVYNIFLLDELCISNPSEYLLQISVQVTSK
jgi:DNA-binding transcriptional MerR regulator